MDDLSANAASQRELLKGKQADAEEALVRIQAAMMQVRLVERCVGLSGIVASDELSSCSPAFSVVLRGCHTVV